jgi:hypothetical protein
MVGRRWWRETYFGFGRGVRRGFRSSALFGSHDSCHVFADLEILGAEANASYRAAW